MMELLDLAWKISTVIVGVIAFVGAVISVGLFFGSIRQSIKDTEALKEDVKRLGERVSRLEGKSDKG